MESRHQLPLGKGQFVAWFMFVMAALLMAYLLVISRRLRPLADDYCAAFHAETGIFEAIDYWWSTWSGDLFGVALVTLVTGLPILLLPTNLASALPFVVTVIGVAVAGWILAWKLRIACPGVTDWRSRVPIGFLVTLGFATAWIGYWWIPANDGATFELGLAVSATMWPTTEIMYILPALIAAVTVTVVLTTTRRAWQFLGPFLGVLIGLSGLVLSLAIALTIGGWLVVSYLFGVSSPAHPPRRFRAAVLTLLGVLVGVGVASWSPGASARSQEQLQDFTLPIALNTAFPETIIRLLEAYTSIGAIVTFLFFAGLGLLVAYLDGKAVVAKTVDVLLVLFIFSVASTFSSALSDGIVYFAVWHQVVPYTLTFLVLSLSGLLLGHQLARRAKRIQVLLAVLAAVAAVGLATSINNFAGVAAEREAEWAIGAAPIGGISDIDEIGFRKCWDGIRRDGKSRPPEPQ